MIALYSCSSILYIIGFKNDILYVLCVVVFNVVLDSYIWYVYDMYFIVRLKVLNDVFYVLFFNEILGLDKCKWV